MLRNGLISCLPYFSSSFTLTVAFTKYPYNLSKLAHIFPPPNLPISYSPGCIMPEVIYKFLQPVIRAFHIDCDASTTLVGTIKIQAEAHCDNAKLKKELTLFVEVFCLVLKRNYRSQEIHIQFPGLQQSSCETVQIAYLPEAVSPPVKGEMILLPYFRGWVQRSLKASMFVLNF